MKSVIIYSKRRMIILLASIVLVLIAIGFKLSRRDQDHGYFRAMIISDNPPDDFPLLLKDIDVCINGDSIPKEYSKHYGYGVTARGYLVYDDPKDDRNSLIMTTSSQLLFFGPPEESLHHSPFQIMHLVWHSHKSLIPALITNASYDHRYEYRCNLKWIGDRCFSRSPLTDEVLQSSGFMVDSYYKNLEFSLYLNQEHFDHLRIANECVVKAMDKYDQEHPIKKKK